MVTAAAIVRPVMPTFGAATFLKGLVRSPEIAHPIQRSDATRMIEEMTDRLLRGNLTSRLVERNIASVPGRTLKSYPSGDAVLSLIHGTALLTEGNLNRAIEVIRPAESDLLTKDAATLLKMGAYEGLGDTPQVDSLMRKLPEGNVSIGIDKRSAYQCLGTVNVAKGILAVIYADSTLLETAAERFNALDKEANTPGPTNPVQSAIDFYQASLSGDFESACKLCNIPRELRGTFTRGLKSYFARLDQATEGKASECLDDFAETVRLLAIEDPFDRWDELSRLIGKDWPEGLSAEDAVRRVRE